MSRWGVGYGNVMAFSSVDSEWNLDTVPSTGKCTDGIRASRIVSHHIVYYGHGIGYNRPPFLSSTLLLRYLAIIIFSVCSLSCHYVNSS